MSTVLQTPPYLQLLPGHAPKGSDEVFYVPIEPFANFLEQLVARCEGSTMQAAEWTGLADRQIRTFMSRTYPNVHIDVVDRTLLTYGGAETLDDLYPLDLMAALKEQRREKRRSRAREKDRARRPRRRRVEAVKHTPGQPMTEPVAA